MLRADPDSLRALGGTFRQASSYLRDRANGVQRGAEELLQGPTGWRGNAPQAFRTSCEGWRDDLIKICITLEQASSVLTQLAYRVEHIEQLRNEARQYESACWDLDPQTPQEEHHLQYLRSRARDLYAAAEMEGYAADQQAATSFREMEAVEKSLNLLYSPVWQQYEQNLLLAKLRGLSKAERMGYYDSDMDEEVFLQDFGKMGNDELRAQIRAREEKQRQEKGQDQTGMVNQGISMGLDFVPLVGNVKSAVEAITGKDYITGEQFTKGDRILAAAGILFGGLKTIGKVGRAAEKGLTFSRFEPLPKVEAGLLDLKKGSDTATEMVKKAPTKVEYGDHFTKEGRRKVLKPNVEYTSTAGYTYKTDEQGRIISAEGKLNLGEAQRNTHAQKVVGREDRLPDDEGGHLIASIFEGSGGLDNLVPMNGNLNKGEWKKLENMWAAALKEGEKVEVRITPIYIAGSQRPYSFDIEYKIADGKWDLVEFLNNAGGGKHE